MPVHDAGPASSCCPMLGSCGAAPMSQSLPLLAVFAWSLFPLAWVTGHLHWTSIGTTELLMMAGNLVAKVIAGFEQVQAAKVGRRRRLHLRNGVAWPTHLSH